VGDVDGHDTAEECKEDDRCPREYLRRNAPEALMDDRCAREYLRRNAPEALM
jgi:hypothetical protein